MPRNHVVSVFLALGLATVGGSLLAADADWLTDNGNVVELKLAHMEKDRIDADPPRRPGQEGPALGGSPGRHRVQGEDRGQVRRREGGEPRRPPGRVRAGVKKGNPKKLRLIPLPHAILLLKQAEMTGGNLQNSMDSAGIKGPDGLPTKVGGASGGGLGTKQLELPKEAVADTQKAVDAIKLALGR